MRESLSKRKSLKMSKLKYQDYEWAMGEALLFAEAAAKADEVPIGACLLDSQGKIICGAGNEKESVHDPCGHAEIITLRKAAELLGDWRLENCTLVVTLEPCLMCMGAIWQSRIKTLVFGAYDSKGGALSLGYDVHKDKRLNHQFSVIGGVKHYETSRLLSQFFRQKRGTYNFKKPKS